MLAERGKKLDHVLVLDAPDEELVMRIAGRRTCESCQATYHVVAKPPRVAGICDRCGGALIQRSDDSEEIVRNRLREYNAKTAPVLDYFEQTQVAGAPDRRRRQHGPDLRPHLRRRPAELTAGRTRCPSSSRAPPRSPSCARRT